MSPPFLPSYLPSLPMSTPLYYIYQITNPVFYLPSMHDIFSMLYFYGNSDQFNIQLFVLLLSMMKNQSMLFVFVLFIYVFSFITLFCVIIVTLLLFHVLLNLPTFPLTPSMSYSYYQTISYTPPYLSHQSIDPKN